MYLRCFSYFLLFVAATLLFACGSRSGGVDGFEKTSSGLEYKIYPGGGKGPVAGSGSTVKMYQYWYWRDTLRRSNRDTLPMYQQLIPGLVFPYDPSETLIQGVRKGDSIIAILRIDSLLAQQKIKKSPPNTHPGDAWRVGIKVLDVFPFNPLKSDSMVAADKLKEEIALGKKRS